MSSISAPERILALPKLSISEESMKMPGMEDYLELRSEDLMNKSLMNRVSNLAISPDKITMGQGEYIVFHQLPAGEKIQLSPETFEKVYDILIQYSPGALISRGSEKAIEYCANRYELIKEKLKKIDPTLEAVFVPRTLYELIFIRKCIKEDFKYKYLCPQLDPKIHKISSKDRDKHQEFLREVREDVVIRVKKCWHRCYFEDAGNNEHAGVKDVAYRLNKVMLKAFNPSSEGFTHREFSVFVEKEIEFLKNHHQKSLQEIRDPYGCRISNSGPTFNFGVEKKFISPEYPMGIRDETDAQMIRDAIALDCSKSAQKSFFLYRGSDFKEDSPFLKWFTPYSLSYGSGLFAGCVHDGGATAFYYMRTMKNAYVISVPFDQLNESPFYIPTTHTVAQLFGTGEVFHGRTRCSKTDDINMPIAGIASYCIGSKDHLKSNLSWEELVSQFKKYKSEAIHLK